MEDSPNSVKVLAKGLAILEALGRGGRLSAAEVAKQVQVPRPDEPPEVMRQRPWFNELTQDLLRRLETDAPPGGELAGLEKWKRRA